MLKHKHDIVQACLKLLKNRLDEELYVDIPPLSREKSKNVPIGPLVYFGRVMAYTSIDKDAMNKILEKIKPTLENAGMTITDLYKQISYKTYRLTGEANKGPLSETCKQLNKELKSIDDISDSSPEDRARRHDLLIASLDLVYNESQVQLKNAEQAYHTAIIYGNTDEVKETLGFLYSLLHNDEKLMEHDIAICKAELSRQLGLGKHEGITITETISKSLDKKMFCSLFPNIQIPMTQHTSWRSELWDKDAAENRSKMFGRSKKQSSEALESNTMVDNIDIL